LSQIALFFISTAFQILQFSQITVSHLKYAFGQITEFFPINTFPSTVVPAFKIAHFSKIIFHLIVTHFSISHSISDSSNFFKK
jgi:hypothetical protein